MFAMRLWLTLLVVLLSICDGEAAKGGAKSIMRGRNKNQGQGGTGFQGYYGQASYGRGGESEAWGEYDSSGDYEGSAEDYDDNYEPPCIGICLLYKQRGETPPKPSRKRACVGKCHHEKLFNLPAQKVQRIQRPCVGICFYLKMKNKTSPESNHPMYQNK